MINELNIASAGGSAEAPAFGGAGLPPLSALGHATPRSDRLGAVTIAENVGLSIASVARRRDGVLPDMPAPGRHAAGVIWTGPGQWLLTGAYDMGFVGAIKARVGGNASVTDQTDGWVVFDIEGPVEALMERLCNVDIRALQPGHATRTVIAHLGCIVARDAGGLRLLGARSSAASLHHALIGAATSIA